jgi:phosphoribosylaminoimidazolecarboxamide formyltransferase/IMP cyclohydrolase
MPRALISVSDKRGVVEFAQGLVGLGWDIVSTGGTAEILSQDGISVVRIEQVTGFPEMMDGRIKTLHPAIHAGLLARRDEPSHLQALDAHGFTPIDLVAVNLYPFRETILKPHVTFADALEQIDIGGPTMLRSAAKNHQSVLAIVDPTDYRRVLAALKESSVSDDLRRQLASKVFTHTASYDATIAQYLIQSDDTLPPVMTLVLERMQSLRYGENPFQRAALYSTREGRGVDALLQLNGKDLSFNNLLDIEGATTALAPWPDRPGCAIIKHTTPCGIALGTSPEGAYHKALRTDPVSAFGSVVAFNTVVDAPVAEAMSDLFVEVVVAPRFHDDALAIFRRRKNLRVIELPLADGRPTFDFKRVRGGFLVQDRFLFSADEPYWQVVSERRPTEQEWPDLRFAWGAVACVKSNAIVLVSDEGAVGIGAGQMSRVDAVFLAVHKARDAGNDPTGSVMASDAFFPFPDGVEQAAEAGITAVIQPGGSKRDKEVIAAANARGMSMVFTSRRQFRH